ncbi:hypothetical protein [Streptococcus suis]|nr:hypothetical protein [Streptococcus suis]CYV23499.1 Uncharacterised protein [Streptococcus suis]
MPRKEGTNPELVIILTHLDSIERPSTNKLSYDLDGNGAVLLDKSLVLAYGTDFLLWNSTKNENYHFDMTGKFSYYYTNDIDTKNMIHNIKKRRNYFSIKSCPLS